MTKSAQIFNKLAQKKLTKTEKLIQTISNLFRNRKIKGLNADLLAEKTKNQLLTEEVKNLSEQATYNKNLAYGAAGLGLLGLPVAYTYGKNQNRPRKNAAK